MPPRPKVHLKGQIERFVSPYEQKLFADWLDPKLVMTKARRKVSENATDVLPGALLLFGTVYFGDRMHEEYAKEHRF